MEKYPIQPSYMKSPVLVCNHRMKIKIGEQNDHINTISYTEIRAVFLLINQFICLSKLCDHIEGGKEWEKLSRYVVVVVVVVLFI